MIDMSDSNRSDNNNVRRLPPNLPLPACLPACLDALMLLNKT